MLNTPIGQSDSYPPAKRKWKGKAAKLELGYDDFRKFEEIFISGIKVKFPFKPYPAQNVLMRKIIDCLQNKQNALLESPTGTGKTLTLLCSSLAWLENEKTRLIKSKKEAKSKKAKDRKRKEELRKAEELKKIFDPAIPSLKKEENGTILENGIVGVNSLINAVASDGSNKSNSEIKSPNGVENLNLSSIYDDDDDDDFQQDLFKSQKTERLVNSNVNPALDQLEVCKPFDKDEILINIPTIYYGTRTHKQIAQVIKELKENTGYRPTVAVLGSREHYCIHPRVSKESNKEEECKIVTDNNKKIKGDSMTQLVSGMRMIEDSKVDDFSKKEQKEDDMDMDMEDFNESIQANQCTYSAKGRSKAKLFKDGKLNIDKICAYKHNFRPLVSKMSDQTYLATLRQQRFSKNPEKVNNRMIDTPVWDIEDMLHAGKKQIGCPYFASRELAKVADIVFCPYNYLISPSIRESMEISLNGNIFIFDEAHNIEDVSRSTASFEIDDNIMHNIQEEMSELSKNSIVQQHAESLGKFIVTIRHFASTCLNPAKSYNEIGKSQYTWTSKQLWDHLAINGGIHSVYLNEFRCNLKFFRDMKETTSDTPDEYEMDPTVALRIPELSTLAERSLGNLVTTLENMDKYPAAYQVIVTKSTRPNTDAVDTKLELACMDSSITFSEISKQARSVILTSGTLSPLSTFSSELDTKFDSKFEANHVIQRDQIWAGVIPHGPRNVNLTGVYNNVQTLEYQDDIGGSIMECISVTPGGVLCFFSSYAGMDRMVMRWRSTGMFKRMTQVKQIFLEPRKGAQAFETILSSFNRSVANFKSGKMRKKGTTTGPLMLAVFRGKLSEGIDFRDDSCRAVLSVGIPFPAFKDLHVILKQEYNNKGQAGRPLQGGRAWYNIQGYRAINQALGRTIRHSDDWGAIILLEARFEQEAIAKNLSKWIRDKLNVYPNFRGAINELGEFMKGRVEIANKSKEDENFILDTSNQSILDSTFDDGTQSKQETGTYQSKLNFLTIKPDQPPEPDMSTLKSQSSLSLSLPTNQSNHTSQSILCNDSTQVQSPQNGPFDHHITASNNNNLPEQPSKVSWQNTISFGKDILNNDSSVNLNVFQNNRKLRLDLHNPSSTEIQSLVRPILTPTRIQILMIQYKTITTSCCLSPLIQGHPIILPTKPTFIAQNFIHYQPFLATQISIYNTFTQPIYETSAHLNAYYCIVDKITYQIANLDVCTYGNKHEAMMIKPANVSITSPPTGLTDPAGQLISWDKIVFLKNDNFKCN